MKERVIGKGAVASAVLRRSCSALENEAFSACSSACGHEAAKYLCVAASLGYWATVKRRRASSKLRRRRASRAAPLTCSPCSCAATSSDTGMEPVASCG